VAVAAEAAGAVEALPAAAGEVLVAEVLVAAAPVESGSEKFRFQIPVERSAGIFVL
jgi:hypothetical protein